MIKPNRFNPGGIRPLAVHALSCAWRNLIQRYYPALFLAAIFCFSLLVPALAEFPSGFKRKLWQTQDGLPEQTVQAFAQSADHYLWVGTTGGLLRFDGARFTLFDHENTPEIKENSVFALLVSRDGSLWIGTEGGGLVRYKEGKFHAYGQKDGLGDGFVRALLEDRGGTIWVGTDNGLLRFTGDRLQRVDGTADRPAIAVHAMAEDHLGGLWVGGSQLLRLYQGSFVEYALQGGNSENRVKSILETSDHTVWVGTVSGLHKLSPGARSFQPVRDISGTVRALRQTSDGTLWIGMIGQGMRTINGTAFTVIKSPDVLPSNTVLNIFEDDERNLWIGTQAGMLRLSSTPVRIVSLPQASDSDFGTIYADRDGTLWVVSTDVFRIRDGIAARYNFSGLEHVPVRNVFRDRAGAMWIGTDGEGIVRMNGGNPLWLTTRNGLVNNFVRATLQDRDGSMWIATDEGLSHWMPQHGFTNYLMPQGLAYFSLRALLQDRNGDLWIGTDRGLSRLHNGVFMKDTATEQLSQTKIWSIHEDEKGGLWFGTRNEGIYRWRNDTLTHFTTEQGLASNSIYQIIEDARNEFWISGPNGISQLSRQELDRAADNPHLRVAPTLYSVSDEMEGTQIYGGRQPSGCVDHRGDVWFPSSRGPIHILQDIVPLPAVSQVAINQVLVDGRPVSQDRAVVIGPGNGRLDIQYAPILLRSQDGVRFRYRLDGFDADWIDASTRHIASYTNLPPGNYTFHVSAYEINHPQAISAAALTVTQKPHFYRTSWFVALCVLLATALVFAIYRLRVWQLKMRFEAVLEERTRLAREMHDTVIQGCASASALLEAIASVSQPGSPLPQELIEHARAQVRATIDEARHAVWNLRRESPSENLLGPALRRMAEQIGKESGIPIVCEISGKPFVLNQFATHELLMMAREAVYNAVLHAKPEQVTMNVCFGRKEVTLEIRDNGSGFDASIIHSDREHHYGLTGMQERVQSVGGRFHLQSAPGKGTDVRIHIPRRVSAAQNAMMNA